MPRVSWSPRTSRTVVITTVWGIPAPEIDLDQTSYPVKARLSGVTQFWEPWKPTTRYDRQNVAGLRDLGHAGRWPKSEEMRDAPSFVPIRHASGDVPRLSTDCADPSTFQSGSRSECQQRIGWRSNCLPQHTPVAREHLRSTHWQLLQGGQSAIRTHPASYPPWVHPPEPTRIPRCSPHEG